MTGPAGRPALVVAADRRRAEFHIQKKRYSVPRPLLSLTAESVEGAVPAEATDQPGETFDRHGEGRHKMEPPTTLREEAAGVFAGAIAERMERAIADERLEGLILIAEPRFLGMLRGQIASGSLSQHDRLEIDKDLVGRDPETLARAIEEAGGLPRLD